MWKSNSNSQHEDDIDIISIGTLYGGGRWEKKYWTSNRGRDRHPYPVGYQAARTYHGIKSTMQILQGDAGPLFLITSSDGHSSSGPTPDIAWKCFQRGACSPLVKSVRGKRLSAHIDGAEFFGFRYSMVQQLLQQLVRGASQGTSVSLGKQIPNQSAISPLSVDFPEACSQYKGAEKRQLELITDTKPKKKLKRPSSAATEEIAKSRPVERQEVDDEKLCAPLSVDMVNDPLSTVPDENLFSVHKTNDALTAEASSPTHLSQDAEIYFSSPTNYSPKIDCDSVGEDVTMTMMKLLLPQAVPLLRKARRAKKKTADVNSLDGKKSSSICPKHNKTKKAAESSKDIIPGSFDTSSFYEHNDFEKLPDIPDSCDELDDNACVRDSFDEPDKGYVPDSSDEPNKGYVPDSCAELDDGYVPDSCDELDNNAYVPDPSDELDINAYVPDSCKLDINAYVPDSCDKLDINAYVPDSCDELDDNAYDLDSYDELDHNACIPGYKTYVLDSCDELDDKLRAPDLRDKIDENAYVSDSCDELDEKALVDSRDEIDDKEIVQDSPTQLNENRYVSDSSDSPGENYNVPDSCDESENVPISTRPLTDVDGEKAMPNSIAQAGEGNKPLDINEAHKETLNLEIVSKDSVCDTRFCEYEGNNSKDNLKHQGRFNLASQQPIQNTNQTSHIGITNVSTKDLHGGTYPVLSNGCHTVLGKCVFAADLNAEPSRAPAANYNQYENVVKHYDAGCLGNNDGQYMEATAKPADMPHSTNVLHDKTPPIGSNEHYAGTGKPLGSDMVNNRQFHHSVENVSSMPATLNLEPSALVEDSNVSAGPIAFDSNYPKLSISKEPEKKLSGFGKFIGLPSYDKELLTRDKNACSTPKTLIHKQSASPHDSNTSAGLSAFNGHCSKLSTVTENENENRLSCFGNLDELLDWDTITDEELLMCDKLASSMTETLDHKQLTSADDSNKLTRCTAFDGNKSMLIKATERENKLNGFGKLIGCYEHPKPVLSVLLYLKGNEAYICNSCGTLQDSQRTLFIYNLKVEGTSAGHPYFVGYSPMLLPDPRCFGRQIALDKSGMQFTPNGQSLVLLNGMQLPSCRNGLVQCQCLGCETNSCEENAVKIVQLKDGYATVLAKLKTIHRVLCLLVCEPNYLVAVEANGAFRFWTMNSTWRYMIKEFILPPTDCLSPCAIELKQIPNCPHLVVGHNCLGEFGLWDISRRTIISRFFIPDTAVFRFIPLSVCRPSSKDNTFTCLNTFEQPNTLKNTSTLWSSQSTMNTKLNLSVEKDVAISILVAMCPDIKNSYKPMPDGCWKLGLLTNNKVVLDTALDARSVTVAAAGDCGVLGTNEGYLDVWDLSTGLKLGASHCFEDGRVQCLYTDNTRSGLLAAADDKGRLLLYLRGQERQTPYL